MISRHSRSSVSRFALFIALLATPLTAQAELKLPAIISDHMVLQQKQANPIWGWDTPGTNVVVAFRGQVKEAKAGDDGKWTVKLDAVDASFEPASIVIEGSTRRKITDVLVGEVWMCSGQS
ncbi:MAG: sialate O-acetylesterase, partial [Fuerstiella sp.]|nr:sialate O-acetylesterase [Fuerstiella sp.]